MLHAPAPDQARLFTRRSLLLGCFQLGVFALITGRLYHLQVEESVKYRTLAEENRISQRLIVPLRGQIKDRNGIPLALNQPNFRLIIDPLDTDDVDVLLQKLGQYVALDSGDFRRIDRDLKLRASVNGVLVSENLSWDQVTTLELRRLELQGARIEEGAVRAYPYSETTSHLLGYIGPPAERDMRRDPLFMAPGFRVGKSGIEQQLDEMLRGTAGKQQLEVDAHGQVVRELDRQAAETGKEITLTLDIGLQQFVQQRLSSEQSAAAVIMDAHNGAVYALASHPGYDPNLFTFGIPQKAWDALNNDPHVPLTNKAIAGNYAPGSVFKIVTALAALDAGVMRDHDSVFCPGHLDLGNHRFHCWKKGGHGTVNLISAMAGSCDTYFYEIAQRVGIDRIQAMSLRLGLGSRTGIDLPHERSGFIPTRQWKRTTQKEEWQLGETLISGIGQGFILTTPLQLAVLAARISNGGIAVLPRLTKESLADNKPFPSLNIATRHLELIDRSVSAVVNSPLGTAFRERIMEPEWMMAGKTGTSQVRRIGKAERASGVIKNENLPWEQRDHALFAGFAPHEKPRYAFSVVVEHGGSGAHVAAPIARDIMIECQKRNPAGSS